MILGSAMNVTPDPPVPADAAAGLQARTVQAILLAAILEARARRTRGLVVGLCGPQGSGKSTMALDLETQLREAGGLSVARLSLDDLYLPGRTRARLASEIHPLLRTRGVPGTHDVARGTALLEGLPAAAPGTRTALPRFDKGLDEPFESAREDVFVGPADVVLFEGWCVGARPEPPAALAAPVNELERTADAQGRWRRYVNEQLAGPYQRLFASLELLIMLRAPRFEQVYAWRAQQEHELAARLRSAAAAGTAAAGARAMSDQELRNFVMHYERLTRHIDAEMPQRADFVLELDPQRQVRALRGRLGGLVQAHRAGAEQAEQSDHDQVDGDDVVQ
jgi:D-glycerate 3-kinase